MDAAAMQGRILECAFHVAMPHMNLEPSYGGWVEDQAVIHSGHDGGIALLITGLVALPACEVDMYYDDGVENWDYKGASTNKPVDWPVTLIFYGPGANVDNVKFLLEYQSLNLTSESGSNMYLRVKDHPKSHAWDSDEGQKDEGWTVCQAPFGPHTGRHIRVYADPQDGKMNNENWLGGFVVATTHWDYDEGCDDRDAYGNSEEVEQWAATQFETFFHPSVADPCRNCYWMDNVATGTIGERISNSDGWATLVYMGSAWE